MKKIFILSTIIISFNCMAHADNTFKLNGQSISGMDGVYYNGQKLSDKNVASYNGSKVSHEDNGIYLNGEKIGDGPKYAITKKKGLFSRLNPLNLIRKNK
jgi:hypothetical protein